MAKMAQRAKNVQCIDQTFASYAFWIQLGSLQLDDVNCCSCNNGISGSAGVGRRVFFAYLAQNHD